MNRILIVDDEASIAEMIGLCLRKNGYTCETAGDGMEASKMIESNHYDLALLDIMMPEIDGFELIEYMKQYDIPVIFLGFLGVCRLLENLEQIFPYKLMF